VEVVGQPCGGGAGRWPQLPRRAAAAAAAAAPSCRVAAAAACNHPTQIPLSSTTLSTNAGFSCPGHTIPRPNRDELRVDRYDARHRPTAAPQRPSSVPPDPPVRTRDAAAPLHATARVASGRSPEGHKCGFVVTLVAGLSLLPNRRSPGAIRRKTVVAARNLYGGHRHHMCTRVTRRSG
jgi:hypothetical protein